MIVKIGTNINIHLLNVERPYHYVTEPLSHLLHIHSVLKIKLYAYGAQIDIYTVA